MSNCLGAKRHRDNGQSDGIPYLPYGGGGDHEPEQQEQQEHLEHLESLERLERLEHVEHEEHKDELNPDHMLIIDAVNEHGHQLNEAQLEAVQKLYGPLMIISGAGSGKTKVITHRVMRMVDEGIDPRGIMALTFTNKAAKELKKRIALLSEMNTVTNGSDIQAGTFHSIFARFLRTIFIIFLFFSLLHYAQCTAVSTYDHNLIIHQNKPSAIFKWGMNKSPPVNACTRLAPIHLMQSLTSTNIYNCILSLSTTETTMNTAISDATIVFDYVHEITLRDGTLYGAYWTTSAATIETLETLDNVTRKMKRSVCFSFDISYALNDTTLATFWIGNDIKREALIDWKGNTSRMLPIVNGTTFQIEREIDREGERYNHEWVSIHAALMITSMVGLLPFATIVARHRRIFSDRLVLGLELHLLVHMVFQYGTILLFVAGTVLAYLFIDTSRSTYSLAASHHYIAIITMSLLGLTAVIAHRPFRPNVSRVRAMHYWNIFHKGVGYAVLALGIINVYTGLALWTVSQPIAYLIIVSAAVGVYAIMAIILERDRVFLVPVLSLP
jgi:UvrD/REP helicase N-terminal domain